MLPMDTVKPTTVSTSVMPAQVQAQMAKEKEAEAARLRLAAEAKRMADKDEQEKKLIASDRALLESNITTGDPGSLTVGKDTFAHAKLAESMENAGIKNLAGALTDEAKVQKYQDTIEAGRLPKPEGFDKVAYENAKKQSEDRIPDSQAAIDVKSPASSASEIANAPPDRVGDVIAKLKEEEKKGGPNFFDVLEAAAAGWNGKIPMYVQKQIAEEEQADALKRMQEGAALDETAYQKRKADEDERQKAGFAFDAEQAEADRKNRLELAGLGGIGTAGGASRLTAGFLGGK